MPLPLYETVSSHSPVSSDVELTCLPQSQALYPIGYSRPGLIRGAPLTARPSTPSQSPPTSISFRPSLLPQPPRPGVPMTAGSPHPRGGDGAMGRCAGRLGGGNGAGGGECQGAGAGVYAT
jgi:hypothetical protein